MDEVTNTNSVLRYNWQLNKVSLTDTESVFTYWNEEVKGSNLSSLQQPPFWSRTVSLQNNMTQKMKIVEWDVMQLLSLS
jgi:hypothetical protein